LPEVGRVAQHVHVHQLGDVAVPEERADAGAPCQDAGTASARGGTSAEASRRDIVAEGRAEGGGLLGDDVSLLGRGLAGPDGLDEVAGVRVF